MKVTKNRYLQGFSIVVVMLALVRCVFPSVAESGDVRQPQSSLSGDSVAYNKPAAVKEVTAVAGPCVKSRFFDAKGNLVENRIWSVSHYGQTFPDSNNVQMVSAKKYGVTPVENRIEAEHRKDELVYIAANPYFHVDPLRSSIPYLVPRAAVLLNDIGRNYFDSLQIKGVPLHQIIVTSVLRTKEDIRKLRNYNGNASENSCHLYGTTFDICYNRYKTVQDPQGPSRRQVRNDSLKWILSEVLRDMRMQNRCYVKYEVKQGCFHITVR